MSNEFSNDLGKADKEKDIKERASSARDHFDDLINYLRLQVLFPNEEINKLVELMRELILNGHIIPAFDSTGKKGPSIFFTVEKKEIEEQAIIYLPNNFVELIKQDPQVQIAIIAYIASKCRDYFFHKITEDNTDEVNERAQAFQAETLILLKKQAKKEGFELEFTSSQKEILEKFPKGLKSLRPKLQYPTPLLDEINSLFAKNSKLN